MANTAQKVRERKERLPHLYCPRCLWLVVHRDGSRTPCPRHMSPEPEPKR